MQDIITINNYAEFEQKFDTVMQETAERFVVIGYLLKVARDTDILRESGYSTMGEFAQKRYGLTKDIASRYIAINDRYSEGGYSEQLDTRYRTFGYAKLAEMLTLPDVIVEEITPEMTREDIRGIKGEVAAEKEISDIEVLIEKKDKKVETLDTLPAKVLYQICRENPDIFKKLWVAAGEQMNVEKLQNILAPSGTAIISCRIPGTGRLMLSAKEDEKNLQIINLRSNEKEEISWEEFASVAVELMFTGENYKEAYKEIYGEEFPEEKTEVAPAQPKTEKVVKAKKPEKPKEKPKKELEKSEPVAVHDEQLPGQMEVADYPEMMPEGEKNGTYEAERVYVNDGRPGIPENTRCDEEVGRTGGGAGETNDEPETTQSNEEKYEEARETAKDRLDAVHAVFWGWENEKKIPKEELELALGNAKNLVTAIEELILMTGEQ